mmetsp:Transcript_7632/g.30219  ORF Transcript_7632/g.30219 Transcript_7632/m.30219 type:complete len:207 (-) Transcript_7632:512-1132(-)
MSHTQKASAHARGPACRWPARLRVWRSARSHCILAPLPRQNHPFSRACAHSRTPQRPRNGAVTGAGASARERARKPAAQARSPLNASTTCHPGAALPSAPMMPSARAMSLPVTTQTWPDPSVPERAWSIASASSAADWGLAPSTASRRAWTCSSVMPSSQREVLWEPLSEGEAGLSMPPTAEMVARSTASGSEPPVPARSHVEEVA